MQHVTDRMFVVFLALSTVLGLLALVSPRLFQSLATRGSRWFDSKKFVETLDRQINVDQYVMPHSRVLGALVLASVAVMTFVYIRH